MWGADRKFRPKGHCLASRGCAQWCKTVIPRDGIFFLHQTLMFDSFSCIPFDFECFILKVAFIITHNDIFKFDVIVTSQSRQPNDKVMWYPIQQMQTNFMWKVSFFFISSMDESYGLDKMGEIRISIPSENLRFPYPVCKKRISVPSENLGFPYSVCKK